MSRPSPSLTARRKARCVNRTPHASHFLALACTHSNVERDIGSSLVDRALHLRPSTLHSSPSLSSSCSSYSSSSSMWVGSVRCTLWASANEELGSLDEENRLTGYEPNLIDNYHISETTDIFSQESSSDGNPVNLHDSEFDDYTICRAIFTTVSGARRSSEP